MQYDKDLVAHKLRRWDKFITDYHLPEWETIPDFGLYMDQVIVLLEQYLSFIPSPAGTKEHFVTSSTINNYVRLKIMPAPVKRKYHRVHIAYLIMILTMKQSLSISDVQKVIPPDSSEEEVRVVYENYSEKFRRLALFYVIRLFSLSENPDCVCCTFCRIGAYAVHEEVLHMGVSRTRGSRSPGGQGMFVQYPGTCTAMPVIRRRLLEVFSCFRGGL